MAESYNRLIEDSASQIEQDLLDPEKNVQEGSGQSQIDKMA